MKTELTSLFLEKADCPKLCRPWEYIVMSNKKVEGCIHSFIKMKLRVIR